jgi:hypothetical protein
MRENAKRRTQVSKERAKKRSKGQGEKNESAIIAKRGMQRGE